METSKLDAYQCECCGDETMCDFPYCETCYEYVDYEMSNESARLQLVDLQQLK